MTIITQAPHKLNQVTQSNFQKQFLQKALPFFICGLDSKQKCFSDWSFDYFSKEAGECEIGLSYDPLKRGTASEYCSIKKYIEKIKSDPSCPYMIGWSYEKEFLHLNDHFSLPGFHPKDFISQLPKDLQFLRKWIFFGKENLCSDLHVDAFTTSAWLMVVKGQKTIRCLSPIHRKEVEWKDSLFDDKLINRLSEKNIDVYSYECTPETLLYMPAGWLHYVRNDNDNIMVTGNFSSDLHVTKFYPNFRELIDKKTKTCDEAYLNYLENLRTPLELSKEVESFLKAEKQRMIEQISLLQSYISKIDRISNIENNNSNEA